MIDALNRYVTTDEVWVFSAVATTAEVTLASFVTDVPSGTFTKGITIRHSGSSAADGVLISVPGKSGTNFAYLYKGEEIFLPISSLTKVNVRSASGSATLSVVAY